jgi:hypothetical protein
MKEICLTGDRLHPRAACRYGRALSWNEQPAERAASMQGDADRAAEIYQTRSLCCSEPPYTGPMLVRLVFPFFPISWSLYFDYPHCVCLTKYDEF